MEIDEFSEKLKSAFKEVRQQRINNNNWNGQLTLVEVIDKIDELKTQPKEVQEG
jgi:hypothetical protein